MKTVSDNTNAAALGWDTEAEGLLKKIPFFVRPFARRKVEEYVRSRNETQVTVPLVEAARSHFMGEASAGPQAQDQDSSFGQHFKRIGALPADLFGGQLDVCRGEQAGCPFTITPLSELREQLTRTLNECGWREFLERSVTGPLLHHHRLKVAVAGCPNACSQPQIKDIGIIASLRPLAVTEDCTGCGTCVEACREGAVEVRDKRALLHPERCVGCGLCVRHCPAKAMESDGLRFRLLVGGKLGRHPRLAIEVASELHQSQVCGAVLRVIEFIKAHARPDERVGDVVERVGKEAFM